MPEHRHVSSEPDPPPDPGTGLVDPRTIHPGPEVVQPGTGLPIESGEQADPDSPPQPAEPDPEAPGLVDPRTEIPGPFGQ